MARLLGDTPLLLHVKHSYTSRQLLAGKLVAFYFSAHWCPPCKRFTQILKRFYEESAGVEVPFEVVFVSSDRSEEEMAEYLDEQGSWLHLPFGHPTIADISRQFSVMGIPFVVVTAPSGEVITTRGRADIENRSSTESLLH